jgi:hypothetical protein
LAVDNVDAEDSLILQSRLDKSLYKYPEVREGSDVSVGDSSSNSYIGYYLWN